MNKLRLVVIACCLTGIMLLWSAPATLLDAGLKRLTEGHLRMTSASGTVWSGSGQLEVRDRTGSAVYVKSLDWQLNNNQLLFGRLSVSYRLASQSQPGTVSASLMSLVFTDIDLQVPASVLESLLPEAHGYGLDGILQLVSKSLKLTRQDTVGTVMLRWQDVSSTLLPVAPLGSYELQLDGVLSQLHFAGSLKTLRGPLQLDGSVNISASQQPVLQVTAMLPKSQYAELAPFMRLVGVEAAGNRFLLQL